MRHALFLSLLAACSSSANATDAGGGGSSDGSTPVDASATDGGGSGSGHVDGSVPTARTVFVIPLENKDDVNIFGNTTDAPYLNSLLAANSPVKAANATNMTDELPSAPSEPHYVWMEAGTNVLPGRTFTTDDDASASNSTSSTAHLSTQLTAAGKTWISYQEGITTGTCPIASNFNEYAPKHNPFVFFQDVAGSPPSANNATCGAHMKAIGDLATDLAAGTVPNYAFITPDLCNDMHGDLLCASGLSSSPNIKAGDDWLKTNLPPLIAYTHTHDAIIILSWDEGNATLKVPLIVIGDHVKPGASATAYTHSSQLKTIEEFLGVPVLSTVMSANDFADMFDAGYL